MTGARVSTIDEARHAGEKLLELGAGNVVLKLGSRGCLGWAEGRVALHLPAFPIHAVDTTAAGDAFTAALAAGWGQMPLEDLLRFANAAGALAATQAGAQPSMPTRDAVDSFLSER
jgi:ribokinase